MKPQPFTEQLLGAIRRNYLDQSLFRNKRDLEETLEEFRDHYNGHRVHQALVLNTPTETAGKDLPTLAELSNFAWLPHCRGLFQTPIAA